MVVNRRRPPAGTLAGLLCVLYAIPRFFLEELRAYDARYLGITPAQYGAVALLITGVLILRVSRSQPRPPYPNGGGYPAA
jgi:phosphatidylglycerol:prolipoprotein diacylglycerol transferase